LRLAALPLAGAALIWALGALPAPAQDDDLIVTHASRPSGSRPDLSRRISSISTT
jgi:hypothetical protein